MWRLSQGRLSLVLFFPSSVSHAGLIWKTPAARLGSCGLWVCCAIVPAVKCRGACEHLWIFVHGVLWIRAHVLEVHEDASSHHGKLELGEKFFLLGLLSGFYPESVGYSVASATVLTGEVRDNRGIATIVPAEEINKLLDSSELQAQRDREASRLQKKP